MLNPTMSAPLRRTILFCCFLIHLLPAVSQERDDRLASPILNVRATLLLFPPTPLLTTEVKVHRNLSLQLESNFTNTHGFNIKYFRHTLMDRDFFFAGMAFLTNEQLRKDDRMVYLPYAGYGYALRFGNRKQVTWDTRAGLGYLANADTPSIFPVVKSGVGLLFAR